VTTVASLVHGVRLLSLDAGNTVIFLDHARLAALAARHGFVTDAAALVRTEGSAKRRHARAEMIDVAWANEAEPGARGWGAMVATTLAEAGFPEEKLAALLADAWQEHVQKNLWCLVPEGFRVAIGRVRARGVKVVLVSNSEGMLDRLFVDLGIRDDFDLLLDSGKVGLEKPDPRIFRLALDAFGVAPEAALHLGDIYSTDILGARAAKMRAALVDPYGHYAGLYADVPRVPGVVAVAEAIAMDRES
jgi:HAD superfamily hydrolase (TIGR01509 family)